MTDIYDDWGANAEDEDADETEGDRYDPSYWDEPEPDATAANVAPTEPVPLQIEDVAAANAAPEPILSPEEPEQAPSFDEMIAAATQHPIDTAAPPSTEYLTQLLETDPERYFQLKEEQGISLPKLSWGDDRR